MREQGAGGETREAVNVRGDVYIRAMVFPPGRRSAGVDTAQKMLTAGEARVPLAERTTGAKNLPAGCGAL